MSAFLYLSTTNSTTSIMLTECWIHTLLILLIFLSLAHSDEDNSLSNTLSRAEAQYQLAQQRMKSMKHLRSSSSSSSSTSPSTTTAATATSSSSASLSSSFRAKQQSHQHRLHHHNDKIMQQSSSSISTTTASNSNTSSSTSTKSTNNVYGHCCRNQSSTNCTMHSLFEQNFILNRATFHYGGDRIHHLEVFQLLEYHSKHALSTHLLFTGSSITAMGYFTEFTRYLQEDEQRNITVINQGKGASDFIYHLHCMDYDDHDKHITPDIIFADLRFLSWNWDDRQIEEAFFRKLMLLRRRDGGLPLLILLNMGNHHDTCYTGNSKEMTELTYNDFIGYYGLSMIDLCVVTQYCFAHNEHDWTHHSEDYWSLYSSDAVHPTTHLAREFIAEVMKEWWLTARQYYKKFAHLIDHSSMAKSGSSFSSSGVSSSISTNIQLSIHSSIQKKTSISTHLFDIDAIEGSHTHCQVIPIVSNTTTYTASVGNNKKKDPLVPIVNHGFQMVTRTKIGAMGFDNIKTCWQGNQIGDNITFAFVGKRLQVAIYQGPGKLGIMNVYIDDDKLPRTTLSSYFEGYSWSKDSGRQYIATLFTNLSAGNHTVTFTISDQPANVKNPGYECQIIALLFSD